jgi:4-aminobutyrate aminotransferase
VSPPGPRAADLVERDRKTLSSSFTRPYPLVIERGEGLWVTDVDGNQFLDFTAGIAVNNTGHAHPHVVRAIEQQARRFVHMSGTDFYYEPEIRLAERLCRLAPVKQPSHVFFTNSGAESIEAAIKLARWATRRPHFLAFTGGFHGRTMGALSLTGSKAIQREGFAPLVPGVFHVPFPSSSHASRSSNATFDRIDEIFHTVAKPESFAAVFVEPIQGEGGYIVPPDDFLPRLRALTSEHGILLVLDEIQSGMGRTGKLFAVEHSGVEPDVIAIAKGIASGMPLGAIIAGGGIMSWPPGSHGSTFGGNPVSCAAALATLDLLEEDLIERARTRGDLLKQALEGVHQRYPGVVKDVRGRGLMCALECANGGVAHKLMHLAFKAGLLVLPTGSRAIRLCPALTVSADEIAVAVDILDQVCADLAAPLSH